jgi:hypothetical protein
LWSPFLPSLFLNVVLRPVTSVEFILEPKELDLVVREGSRLFVPSLEIFVDGAHPEDPAVY